MVLRLFEEVGELLDKPEFPHHGIAGRGAAEFAHLLEIVDLTDNGGLIGILRVAQKRHFAHGIAEDLFVGRVEILKLCPNGDVRNAANRYEHGHVVSFQALGWTDLRAGFLKDDRIGLLWVYVHYWLHNFMRSNNDRSAPDHGNLSSSR